MSQQGDPRNAELASCAPLAQAPLTSQQASALAETFHALSDPVRLRLLSLIAARSDGEVCVCHLTEAFDLTGPTISYHLKVLRQAGLIDCQRRGTWVYYWVQPAALRQLASLLDTAMAPA